jgi:fatty acid-binding protein DegV
MRDLSGTILYYTEAAEWYKTKMVALTGKKPVSIENISPVIGANAGVGASAVAFMCE